MEPAGQVVLLAVSLAFVNPVTAEINVGLNKKASQSSLLRSEYPAERAVDGNTGTILYPLKECTHTDLEYEPWWKVDLGDTYVISHVTVINRGDCCGERLRNFMLRVGPYEDFRENTPCGDIYSEIPSEGETIDVRCEEPISGRWVSVQLIGREDYLSLCEVQVFSGTDQPVAPSITHPPVDTTGVDGDVITLFCEANMKLNILWQKGGRTIIPGARNRYDVIEYHNGRASALRIDPLRSPRDNDTFTCRAESVNDGSVVEASAAINILTEGSLPAGFPDITWQPQLKAVEKGRPTVLVCSASGDPAPDITWLKDMVPVDMTDDRIKLLSSGSLQINSTREEDEGTYECVATNSLGTRYSYKANLYVRVRRVPPYFITTPENVEVNRGDDVNLTCVAFGSPMPFVQWLKDYENVEEQTSQNGRNILQLENLVESANYTCAASSELGLIEHKSQVTVKVAPSITHPPVDTTGVDGGVITLFCEANVKLNIEWRKGDRTIIPSATNRYDVIQYQHGRASALRIDPLRSPRDNDTFTCRVENDNDGSVVEASAAINILTEDSIPAGFPDINRQPQLKAVEKGRPTVLVCSASGDPAPDITWLKDMVPVDMADDRIKLLSSGSLQINSTREEDEGTYECVATNSLGTRYSYKANLYVRVRRVPPYFITTPENVEVNRGDDVNLTCVAIGSPMPFVQWLKDYENVEEQTSQNGRNILQLENVVESANYTCAASSELGLIEHNAQVTVKVPISITHPPVDTTGVDGDVITLFCEANMKLNIEWRKGGRTIIPSARNRYDVIEYQNGRASALRIDPLRSTRDNDTFTCNVENVNDGSVVEASASVNIMKEGSIPAGFPDITWQPQLKAVEKGRPTVLVCSASGDPAPGITWLKDMVPVDMTDDRIKLLSSGSLQISSTREEDEGTYECVATNSLGTRYSYKANLYVRVRKVPPYFTITPENVEVNQGDNVNLTCVAIGSPMPFVQWLKDYENVEEQTSQNGRNILQLENLVESANYTCAASSELGLIEYNAEVTVKDTLPMVDGYTARRGGCPGNDIWIIYARSTTLEQCARECTIHPRCVAFQFFDNHECYPKSKSCEETVKTNPKNVLYDKIVDTLPMVDGYTARRGGCPGNDIWIIYARSTTLEQCARECTIHPQCVAFQFFDNHECYPKSKSCEETVKTNPKNVLYDKIVDTPPMVDGYTARRGGCPGNDIWIIYARSTTLEQCARECTIHPRCVAFQFFDNHECYPKSKSCEETVKTNPKNVLYDRIADTPPMVDGYTARRGGCPGNDIWVIYARSTTLEQCARECTIHPRCVAFQFFDNHECYPKSKSCEETVKTNSKNVLYDRIVDTPPMVDGYTARRGGCPGNDIWIIYARSTTLEQCARECTIHPRCVAFQFFDNHECYPKSKSCEETVKTNPKNVLYDKIVGE
ncbi:PREDICTED: hemicentin-1-like [Branchiostoma belcheri]|uniref:protein-tyrosine-phosphatase n=1 Tax=Branchiostoma belcheri TaxID=7741 RepID=A0A6P4ZKP6_BRABE|nr:PREDICTED: hemicentin-1-like [Branchiostoma belcheri]